MKSAMFALVFALMLATQAQAKVMTCTAVTDASGHTNSGAGIVLPMKFSYIVRGDKIALFGDSGVGTAPEHYSVNGCVGAIAVSSFALQGKMCVPNRATLKNGGKIVVLTDNADGEFAYYRCN